MKTTIIPPIETIYNGLRFRSRLEARWAVFFDAANIKYEYEPDGFEFNGEKYLPDFYLPDHNAYIEVKPDDSSVLDDIARAANVCCRATLSRLIILSTIPKIGKTGIWAYNCFYYNAAEDDILWRPAIFHLNPAHSLVITGIYPLRLRERNFYYWVDKKIFPISGVDMISLEGLVKPSTAGVYFPDFREDSDYFYYNTETQQEFDFAEMAYSKARKARFEFGETPETEETQRD